MSDKKESDSKPSTLDLESPDFTSSITETDHEGGLSSMNSAQKLEHLLGRKSLSLPKDARVLLRIADGILKPALASSLKAKAYHPNRRTDDFPIPLILGPFDHGELRDLAEQGLFRPQDCVQVSYGRWRLVKDIFSEFVEEAHTDEITNTMTATATESSEVGQDTDGGLELDAVDDTATDSLEGITPVEESESKQATGTLDLEDDDFALNLKPVPEPRATAENPNVSASTLATPKAKVSPSVKPRVNQSSRLGGAAATLPPIQTPAMELPQKSSSLGVALVIALIGGVALFFASKKDSTPTVGDKTIPVQAAHVAADWPENLRPQTVESLYSGESGLLAKIRPILNAYENGTMVMSAADERILKEVSDPASSSFEARRLAANQLAVFYLAASRVEEARQALTPILESGTSDPTTLLNMALLQLTAGEYAEARDSATAALRLVPPAHAWIAHSVVGLVEGYRGKLNEAEANFKDALRRSLNNPFVYGLYIRTLSEIPGTKERLPELIRDALWSDPDRLIDSPIRAPLAGHILVSFALEGLLKGAELKESRLSAGKVAFVRWLEARYRRNPLSQPLARVRETLSHEDDAQSQLLYAFSLREQGKLDEASEVMSRVTTQLQSQEELRSSFPWSFAGDIQYARRNVSQAIVLYQNALSRNPRDISAVLGMALAFRDSGEYKMAEQKMAEALSLDPFFIPVLLRVSRFEWHGGGTQ